MYLIWFTNIIALVKCYSFRTLFKNLKLLSIQAWHDKTDLSNETCQRVSMFLSIKLFTFTLKLRHYLNLHWLCLLLSKWPKQQFKIKIAVFWTWYLLSQVLGHFFSIGRRSYQWNVSAQVVKFRRSSGNFLSSFSCNIAQKTRTRFVSLS